MMVGVTSSPTDFRVVLIQPAIVHRKGDIFGNIPFMPTGITYLAGYVRSQGFPIRIIDGFGLSPARTYAFKPPPLPVRPAPTAHGTGKRLPLVGDRTKREPPATAAAATHETLVDLCATGLTPAEIVARLDGEQVIGIAIHASMSHSMGITIANEVRKRYPKCTLVAGGHHASETSDELLAAGFDYVVLGEGERPFLALLRYLRDGVGDLSEIDGLAYGNVRRPQVHFEKELDQFGHAAHDLLPLENYWRLGMSHAPVRGRYVALTTSRGCPYNCRFCTTPKMLGRRWRTRTAAHVVDEIEHAMKTFGATDFIIQDEIFVVVKKAALAFAEEVLARKLSIRFYLPSGVKVECVDKNLLTQLRKAGLQYISLAPESGSQRVLKRMDKPLNVPHLLDLVEHAHAIGLRMGAFFIIGFEDENDDDRRMTKALIRDLIKRGVDDVSLFIWSPLPGADAFGYESGWTDYEQLNWSPTWRKDYAVYARFRAEMLLFWLACRLRYRPREMLRSLLNVGSKQYALKSEMAMRRSVESLLRFS